MRNKGFTFFELLLVLGLIIIVSSIVTINSAWLVSEKNTSVIAKQLQSHLNYIQQKAIAENKTWVIEFIHTNEKDEYHIYPDGQQHNPVEIIVITNKLVFWGNNNGEYLPPNTIKFNYLGAPLAEKLVFALCNKDNKQLYLSITPVTGRVKITKTIN
ncbi:hypothetical protein IMX26_03565 [Clostridium sp. 'deep sea']|uniref:hypothetical protein n=1 Tax=Clostridium sp. 'deep sea' TaxID=2779445 RepID=UPI00189640FB|nr:hypothetical protein [Clostridium sp. 'deep sea']QOR35908.1 hypothetical protein IMX26_03565 [Clostridium sp. 'deep sea']